MCIVEFLRFALHYLSIFFSRCAEIAALLVWIIFILLGLKLLNHVYNVLWFVFSLLWFQFKPLEQLMGVFPAASGKFLPPTWRELMSHQVSGKSSFLIDFYISVFYWSIDCLVDMFVDVYYLNSIFIDWLNDWFVNDWLLFAFQDSAIIDFYPLDFEIDLNGKKYAWQGTLKNLSNMH